MRKEFDFYPTPISIVKEIAKRWSFEGNKVWEPCAGDGRMSEELERLGHWREADGSSLPREIVGLQKGTATV